MKCRKPLNLLGLRHFFFYVVIAVKMLKMQYFATLCNTKNDDTIFPKKLENQGIPAFFFLKKKFENDFYIAIRSFQVAGPHTPSTARTSFLDSW